MSNPTVSQVRTWLRSGHALTDAAASIDGAVDTFDGELNSIGRNYWTAMDSWRGDAATASQARSDSEKQTSSRLAVTILDIADDMNRLGPTFVYSCEAAAATSDEIVANGYVLADNGTVTAPDVAVTGLPGNVPVIYTVEEGQKVANTNAVDHQADLARLLRQAGQADADMAREILATLGELKHNADRATSEVPIGKAVQNILDGKAELPTDPQRLNAFWDSLTSAEKAELWNHNRDIGNMDGIPAADRDHFNRRHLPEQQRQAQEAIDSLYNQHPEWHDGYHMKNSAPGATSEESKRRKAYDAWVAQINDRKKELDGYNGIENAMGGDTPPKFLLLSDGSGKAAIAVGTNPDLAKNVATYVPGTGSNTTNMSGGVNRADAMFAAANRADPAVANSVVAWYGYDAPQELGAAAGPASAASAAQPLDNFQSGLRATHEGATPSHNTVLGHSYGTTVVGEAASEGHTLDADDVVFVASPGAGGPSHADELSLTGLDPADNGGRVWATTGQHDPIKLSEGIHGASPNNPNFGGHRFSADSEPGAWYGMQWNPDAHSSYWDRRNLALENMGKIIVDREDTR